jgi:MFS family permease
VAFLTYSRFTGIIPIANYQVIIYQMLGSGAVKSLVLTVAYGAVTTLGALTSGFWLDKVGRRTALVRHSSYLVKDL